MILVSLLLLPQYSHIESFGNLSSVFVALVHRAVHAVVI